MNKAILIGNLANDPETRTTSSGIAQCTFRLAVQRRFANQQGVREADFLTIVCWRQTAELCSRYLSKGRKVAVVGELQARTYEAKDGTTRMSLDVAADEVEFLTPRSAEDSVPSYSSGMKPAEQPNPLDGFTDIQSDDIPF